VRDFRRTYSLWLESAGVPRNRISLYMGHGPRDMTTLYQKQRPTTDLLNEDRQRILDWIESQKASQNKKTKRVWADSTDNFLAKLVAAS
jgi:integrase